MIRFYNTLLISLVLLSSACQNADQNRKNAKKLFKERNFGESLMKINKAIDQEPNNFLNYEVRSIIHKATGHNKEEIEDLNLAIKLNTKSKSIHFHYWRSMAEISLSKYNDALSDINFYLENRDTVGSLKEGYMLKAGILAKLEHNDESRKYYLLCKSADILENRQINSQVYIGLANLCKSPKEALLLLNQAVRYDTTGVALGARMVLYFQMGKSKEAYRDGHLSILRNPNDPTMNYNMGQLFANDFNIPDSAIKYYEKTLALSPQSLNSATIFMNLAVIYHLSGHLDTSDSYFLKALALNPKDGILLYNYALLLSDKGRNKDADDKISQAILVDPKNSEYYDSKGTFLNSLSQYDEAEAAFRSAILLNPKYGQAYYNLGCLLGERNQYTNGIISYDKAVYYKYDLKSSLVNRGVLKLKINDNYGACIDLRNAYKLGRTDVLPLIQKYGK